MALIPTKTVRHVLEGYQDQDLFTEANQRTVLTEGWYSHPSLSQDQLIEREYMTVNQFGSELHRTIERWDYDRPGGPPKQYHREVWSKAYVPQVNPGRSLKLMEEETTVFWTFAPWSKDALGHRREINAWVVYDLAPTPNDDAEKWAKLEAKGLLSDGYTAEEQRYHVASGKLWSEAVRQQTNVEVADANQTARWVKNVIHEEVDVTEEIDRYTVWGWRKYALRPDDVELIGPRYVKKQDYKYRLDVPVWPPSLEARDAGDDGVRLVMRGGGASVSIPLTTGARSYDRGPEEYKVFRKKIDEADRDAGGDPWGIWDEDAPEPRRSIIETYEITDYDGVEDENEGLPSQTTYDEPHDSDPFIDDSWNSVGTTPNEVEDIDNEVGRGVLYDTDVTNGSTYVYAAVAVVQSTESELSNQAEVTYEGGEPATYKISIIERDDGTIEGDLTMPDDPSIAIDFDIGDVFEYDIPAAVIEAGIPSYPADHATLTAAETVNASQETFSITPPNVAGVWEAGRALVLTDNVGPGKPDAAGVPRPYRVAGKIKSLTGTTLVVEYIDADNHLYPIGSTVEPQVENYLGQTGGIGDSDKTTMEALVLAVGSRQGQKYRDESFDVTLTAKVPLIGLQVGARVVITGVDWGVIGNDLLMRSRVKEDEWYLKGWEIAVGRDESGNFVCDGTKLYLGQR